MKSILRFSALSLVIFMLLYISCKKEFSCEGCINGNKPPISNAGPDQVITLPTDSVLLDGSFDITTGTWSIGVMTRDIRGASIISVNNTIYVAGGSINGVLSNQVWKLEF